MAARLADWQLDYPLDPGALKLWLETGVPDPRVLRLGELRKYADADAGPAVLAGLADLLDDPGHLIITTLWPEHWTTYIAAACAGPGMADPAGIAGQLRKRLELLAGEGYGQEAACCGDRSGRHWAPSVPAWVK